MLLTDLFEDLFKGLFKENKDVETKDKYNIVFAKNFNKLKLSKCINTPKRMIKIDDIIDELIDNGDITHSNVHTLKQKINSEYSGKKETGWKSIYISTRDDLRMVFKRFPDNSIEVKFGSAKDCGYKH